jgi:acetamidase/formamidase
VQAAQPAFAFPLIGAGAVLSLSPYSARTVTVDAGAELTVEVRGAFDDVEDITAVPTPFTPACYGHSLAPIGGPIVVRSAKPRDVVAIDLIELAPFGTGKSAILRGGDFL